MTTFALALLAALFAGTLVEWIWHRWVLHAKWGLPARVHRAHHRDRRVDGIFMEALALAPAALAAGWVGFLWSFQAGLGWACGGAVYVVLAARAHRRAHLAPDQHHTLHHRKPTVNFGLTVTWFDRLFGTHQPACSLCGDAAVARFDMPGGCVAAPDLQVQDLCTHHVRKASPGAGMFLTKDYTAGGAFGRAWAEGKV